MLVRRWLFRANSLQNWQGWASLLWPFLVAALPFGIGASLQRSLKGPWIVSYVLAGLLVLALIALWREIEYDRPTVSFELRDDQSHRSTLRLTVRKTGRSLQRAAILLEVPASWVALERIWRDEDDYKQGERIGDRLVWDEHGLEIQGGGIHPTVWEFTTHAVPPGSHRIHLVISDDDLRRAAKFEHDLTLTESPTWERAEAARLQQKDNLFKTRADWLEADREVLTAAMRSDEWTPSAASRSKNRTNQSPATVRADDEFMSNAEAEIINHGLSEGFRIFKHYQALANQLQTKQTQEQRARQQAENAAARSEGRKPVALAPSEGRPILELEDGDEIERAIVANSHALDVMQQVRARVAAATTAHAARGRRA